MIDPDPPPKSTSSGTQIVLVASGLGDPGSQGVRSSRSSGNRRPGRPGSSRLYPSDLTDCGSSAICDTGVPCLPTSGLSTSRAVDAPYASLGRRRAVPSSRILAIRAVDEGGVPIELHRRYRERPRTMRCISTVEHKPQLDWCSFFFLLARGGTYAVGSTARSITGRDGSLNSASWGNDITGTKSRDLRGFGGQVLVDGPGMVRSPREAPEIDGVVVVSRHPRGRGLPRPAITTDGPRRGGIMTNPPGPRGRYPPGQPAHARTK